MGPRQAHGVTHLTTADLESALDSAAVAKPNAGRPGVQRLNRSEFKNTIRDFLFRAKLPMPQEDEQLSRRKEFWKLIEEGERTRTR